MKKLLIIIALGLIILISGCDSRELDQPGIQVTISAEKIYNVGNYEEAGVVINLSGKDTQISNAIVDVVYNDQLINVITNTGTSNYFRTDATGRATGTIIARSPGIANITFTIRNWSKVNAVRAIQVSNPEILYFAADPDTLPANNSALSNLSLKVYPPLEGYYCLFTSSLGNLTADSTQFDSQGISRNSIKSSEAGNAIISGTLSKYPTIYKNVNVRFD